MRYRLRTLLIVLAVGPPVLWAAYLAWDLLRSSPPPAEKPIYYSHRFVLDVF
jgi:hypothetical protein